MIKIKTNYGDMELRLHEEKTPVTVANFLAYVKEGFYDGTLFHRVIPRFMIQGGGFDEAFQQKKTRAAIENEANKGAKNTRGTIAMARTGDPHSATAQFFINAADNAFLDFKEPSRDGWGYCVFGEVVAGIDVLDKIQEVATHSRAGHQDVPQRNVVIETIEVLDDAV
ncbi:MAG: peptidyl-prolyl cis-transisomerase [Gammaproteobacteria bacterium]|jgi:peptidyl-prolyl cis-trans isomerase B (cyclophilin B)|nr:peptidyl-prolyl cis-transisomerase [Gammaproteobacteria bacterium]